MLKNNLRYFRLNYLAAFTLFLLSILSLNAQNNQGIVSYKYTLFNEEGSSFPGLPPSFEIITKLNYTSIETFYERDFDQEVEIDPTDRRARWIRRMMLNRAKTYYKNIEENTLIEALNLFGKDFIIPDSLHQRKWKISAGEQKDILGYLCMKATFKDSTENFVVYFTPQIPLPHGPDEFNGLPGLILEVQSAEFHLLAQSITQDKPTIRVPQDGEKISRDDFNTLRDEKTKERQEMWGR